MERSPGSAVSSRSKLPASIPDNCKYVPSRFGCGAKRRVASLGRVVVKVVGAIEVGHVVRDVVGGEGGLGTAEVRAVESGVWKKWCLAGAAGGEKLALALARVEALARDEDGTSWTPPGAGEAGSRKAPGKGLGPHIAGEVTLATCPRPTVSCPSCLGKAGSSPAEVGLPGASRVALWVCARPWSEAGVCRVS